MMTHKPVTVRRRHPPQRHLVHVVVRLEYQQENLDTAIHYYWPAGRPAGRGIIFPLSSTPLYI